MKKLLSLLSLILLVLLTACPMCYYPDTDSPLFNVTNNSYRLIDVAVDTTATEIGLKEIKEYKYYRGRVLYPFSSSTIMFDNTEFASKEQFLARYPVLNVYVCDFQKDTIFKKLQVTEAYLKENNWNIIYEDK